MVWVYTQQVQGSNGSNAAQFDCPQGSTLTFQHNVGVSWAQGLRHGVAMHPRGRHLREGRIPWSHGKSHSQVRERQPPHQPQQLHDNRRFWSERTSSKWRKNKEIIVEKLTKTQIGKVCQSGRDDCKRTKNGRRQEIADDKNGRQQHDHYYKFPLRGVSQRSSIVIVEIELGEFNLVVEPKVKMPNGLRKLAEPLRARSNLVSQRNGESEYSAINWKRRRQESIQRPLPSTISKTKCDGPAATKCCWSDRSPPYTINSARYNRTFSMDHVSSASASVHKVSGDDIGKYQTTKNSSLSKGTTITQNKKMHIANWGRQCTILDRPWG